VFHSLNPANGTITLSSVAQTYANRDKNKNTTCTIYNAPYPLIDIKKVDTANKPVNGAVYTVYTKNADGTFSPVMKDGAPVTINTNLSSVNNNTTIRLEPDVEYYFAETTVPDGYLDPNENFEMYHNLSSDYVQGTVSGTTTVLTFVKGKVTNMPKNGTKDNVCTFTFKNIPNGGSLKVLKYVDGVLANGFEITVTYPDGTVKKETTKTVDNVNGVAIFENIPVYEADGTTKIEYVVSENMSPTQQETYTRASADQTATLTIGEQTDKDTSGNPLAVYNTSKINLQATKVFRKLWNYSFTQYQEPLAGATIGLFEQGEDGNWVLVDPASMNGTANPQASDGNGDVHFNGLERGKDYIMVELATGDPKKFPWNGSFKQLPAGGADTTTIPASELNNYNVIRIDGNTTKVASGNPANGLETFPKETAYMINANHWVQFHITKWLDPVADRILGADEFGRGKTHDPYNTDENFSEADNVIFEVFRYIIPDGESSAADFNLANPAPWVSLGRYTTGTLYVNDERQIGQFITAADQDIDDHYVYMIVEVDEGPNSFSANPNFKYTFFYPYGKTYTVNVTGGTPRNAAYEIDTVNHEDVLNYTGTGPGTTLYLLASIRLSKFQDSFNLATGDLNEDYQPLPGATFQVCLADGTLITELTVGLDDKLSDHGTEDEPVTPLAMAQSGTFGLTINKDQNTGEVLSYDLVDYENQITYEDIDVEVSSFEAGGHTYPCWRIPVTVTETEVPDGFSPTTGTLNMYLVFVDVTAEHKGESWVFNDAYLVTTIGQDTTEKLAADQVDTAWYVRNASNASHVVKINNGNGTGDTVNPSPLRIVNIPTTNTPVHLFKYGYTPNVNTLSMTGDQLNGVDPSSISRTPLKGVTMVIERKDGNSWKPWNYDAGKEGDYGTEAQATFVTEDNGFYRFEKGLPEGTYRIWEKSIGNSAPNYNYEITYTKVRPRVFTVGKSAVELSLYNPAKFRLRIKKTDMNGNPISGVRFMIRKVEGGGVGSVTDNDGVMSLGVFETGNYWIEETMAGYSSAYLQQYLNSTYGDCMDGFTDKNIGAAFGYIYTSGVSDGRQGTDVVISEVTPDRSLLKAPAEFWLDIKNPKTTDLKLTKSDEYDPETKLQNAEFIILYLPFEAFDGDINVQLPTLAKGTTAANATTAFKNINSKWVRRYVGTDGKLSTTGSNARTNAAGEISFTDVDPGVYAFYEITTPSNYDVVTDTNGNALIYTAVVKGGIPVNVTVTPSSVTVKDYSGALPADKSVQTSWISNDGTQVNVEAANRPRVKLKALKEVSCGLIENPNWRVVLNLYSDSSKRTKVGTVTINNTTNQGEGITFKNPNNNADALFSLGQTYYLEEEIQTPENNFVLNEVLKDGVRVTDVAGGLYLFPVESINGFTITARNDYLYGIVTFSKVDEADHLHHLNGAVFEVRYKNEANEWVKVPNSTVVEDPEGNGNYKANIPLVSKNLTTYRIYETDAPTDYLLPEDYFFEVELSLADNVKNNFIEFPNTEGNELIITKYTYVHGTEQNPNAGAAAAKFAIYHLVDGKWVLEKEDWVDENGRLMYLTVPGDQYAIKETDFDRTRFNEMESIYQASGTGETKLISQSLTLADGTVVEDAYALTVVNDLAAINISAFNVPNLTPTIAKEDAGHYQGGARYPKANVKASMSFAVYEITEDDGEIYSLAGNTQPTRAQVEAFLAAKTQDDIVFSGTTETYDANVRPNGTSKVWESSDVSKRWSAAKTYLLVETGVTAMDGGAYDTLQKDNPEVVWYYRIPKNPSEMTWTLHNYYGDASVTLAKEFINKSATDTENDVVNKTVDSLLEGERKAVFTLTPTVTSQNQMLSKFVLKDAGLTATDRNNGAVDVFNYTFTKIEVGGAYHDTSKLGLAEGDAPISAKIVFYSELNAAEGTEIAGADVIIPDVNSADPVTAIPAGAKSFTISYYSEAVTNATASYDHEYLPPAEDRAAETFSYVLGEGFRAQPTKVYVTLERQADGDSENWVKEIRKVKNDSAVTLEYPKWEANGSGLRPAGNTATANDTINVNTFKLPLVAISKAVPSTTARLGGTVKYTITIKNAANSPVEFKNPIALDILPTAVSYVMYSAPEQVTATGGEVLTVKTNKIQGGASVVTSSGVEVSEFNSALEFKLTGTLGIGSSVSIEYTCVISENADLFANVLQNDVYLSSSEKSYHTEENKHGWPFKNEGNDWGNTLDNAARNVGGSAQQRENAMMVNDVVQNYASEEYEWIAATVEQNINEQTSVTLRKAVRGDRDEGGFHDTKVGVATRTNHRFFNESGDPDTDQEGWVQWRLSVSNGYTDRDYLDHLIIGDVIPNPGDGDQRESQWYLDYDKILYVENNRVEITPDQYTVYFYTGPTEEAEAALLTCMNAGGNTAGWTAESVLAAMEDEGERAAFIHSISAFVVIFDEDIQLLKNTSMYLVYNTNVVNNEDDNDFNNNRAFKNNANYYFFHYYDPSVTTSMKSNTVSVMITDKPVEVQGDLWVDEDQDGEQEATNRRDYSQYAIINQLIGATTFSIKDLREASGTTSNNDTGEMSQWDGGESIKHFRFDGLGAAVAKRYEYTSGNDPMLDWHALKGEDPYRYSLIASIADTGDLLKIIGISPLGDGHYLSDNPDEAAFVAKTAPTFLDNNFDGSNGNYTTYPFYVRYSNNIDQSKDIGVIMKRGLEIKKMALDDPNFLIEGAEFQIYGPFAEGEGTAASGSPLKFTKTTVDGKTVYTLDPEGTETTLKTGADGTIAVEGLNWWKEYVVKETKAGDGFEIEGAVAEAPAASGTEITDLGNGTFTLKIPSTEKVTYQDKVDVKDPRKVKIQLNVEKILETLSEEEFTFNFSYWVANITPAATAALNEDLGASDTDPIETISLTLSGNKTTGTNYTTGSFAELELNGAGVYKFVIKENAPDPLPDGWTYDPEATRVVTVTVTWDADAKKLVAAYAYDDYETIDGKDYEKFTNEYEKEGSWIPEAIKELTGRPLQAGEFTFEVKEGSNVVSTGTVNADGTVTFTPVSYTLAHVGTHNYTMTEVSGSAAGVTYATNSIAVTVTVTDDPAEEELQVAAVYSPEDKKFVNTYHAEGEWAPEVRKKLTGSGMEAGEEFKEPMTFTVTVTDTDTNTVVMTGTATVTKSEELENFVFTPEKVEYDQTKVGDHHYLIVETVKNENGVTCDTTQYTVTVQVRLHRNEDGTYSEVLDVTPDGATNENPIIFNNTYGAEGTTHFEAKKVVTNGNQTIGTDPYIFTFTLKDSNGDPIESKTAGSDGKVQFTDISYDLSDAGKTFTYTISEVTGNIHNMVYDDTIVTVKVTPVDNGDGTMTVTPHYYVEGDDGELVEVDAAEVIFTNEQLYSLKLKKVLEEIEDDGRTFDFTIKLTKDGAAYTGYEAPTGAIDWTEAEAGVYTFKLTHNTEIELVLPAGVEYEIQEISDGYTVNIEVKKADGTQISYNASQDTITGEITSDVGDHDVVYTNLPGLNIPLTGGSGTLPYTAAGLMMMIAAFGCGLFLRHRKKEERA